jgi:hypothetical protein
MAERGEGREERPVYPKLRRSGQYDGDGFRLKKGEIPLSTPTDSGVYKILQ